jgi:hypothetical protein
VRPLLKAVMTSFSKLRDRAISLQSRIRPEAADLWSDVVDSLGVTTLRATQVYHLFEYASSWDGLHPPSWRQAHLEAALGALHDSVAVIRHREEHYRLPVDRVAYWRPNPTAYGYGYLWTVKSAFYFVRDHMRAALAGQDVVSPCFMNIINPIDVALGEGIGYFAMLGFLKRDAVLSVADDRRGFFLVLQAGLGRDCATSSVEAGHFGLDWRMPGRTTIGAALQLDATRFDFFGAKVSDVVQNMNFYTEFKYEKNANSGQSARPVE